MSGYVLVELTEEWEGVYTVEKKYDTKTSGIVIKVPTGKANIGSMEQGYTEVDTAEVEFLLGKKVYFEGFKDDSQVKDGDKIYAFIDIKDIRGYKSE